VIVTTEDSASTGQFLIQKKQLVLIENFPVNESETASNPVIETNEPVPPSKTADEEHDSDGSADTIEEKDEKPSTPPPTTVLVLPKEKSPSDDGK
jgi:hypothetical protein